MQIRAEPEKSALSICNYSQILYQFFKFTQNLKQSRKIRFKLPFYFLFSIKEKFSQSHYSFAVAGGYCFTGSSVPS